MLIIQTKMSESIIFSFKNVGDIFHGMFHQCIMLFCPQSLARPPTCRRTLTVRTTRAPCRGRPALVPWATWLTSPGVTATLCPATPTTLSAAQRVSTVESSTTPTSSPSERRVTAAPPPLFCWPQVHVCFSFPLLFTCRFSFM